MKDWVRLCGVITKILPNGEFAKCNPVFVKESNFGFSEPPLVIPPPPYYHYKKNIIDGKEVIVGFEMLDIQLYGPKVFLPANHKKMNNGKEYYVVYQPTKNYKNGIQHWGIPCSRLPCITNVGILFPNKFITVKSKLGELSTDKLLTFF